MYFLLIGIACAGIVHGIFITWDILRYSYNNVSQYEEEECLNCLTASTTPTFYPSFDIRNAYDFASVVCSFLLNIGSMFALYVATSEAKLTALL